MNPEELSDVALGRVGIYALLADVLNNPPDTDHLRALHRSLPLLAAAVPDSEDAPVSILQDILDKAVSSSEVKVAEELTTEIGVERTRTLRGVKPGYGLPPATDSVYSAAGEADWAQFQPERNLALLDEYAATGFVPEPHLPPDFLGNEIAYLSFLCRQESAAWVSGDQGQALFVVNREVGFIDNHPLRWVGRLLQRVRENTTSPFWSAFLSMLIAWLRSDRDYLLELLEDTNPEQVQP